LGGDGTVLQAARETIHSRIPLIGVNLGSLGFMTQIEPTGIEVALDRLIDGDYREESRMLLQGKASLQGGVTKEGLALNDIVITRSGALRVILLRIYVNGSFLHEYQADGMIITTPTGSTGYNLSAGGPLVEPGAKLLMLTPICPHSLNHRSIILSSEDEIEIEIPLGKEGKEQKVEASLDGGNSFTMVTGDRITIKKSQESARFLQLSSVSFLETLHQKMKD
ncbi:MAG: NAD(+)/NADH kinase, partial [Lachnospiraceae bacterium]|nr:NAD(+)/NADH kinase [Lachnospiraceae bacterium]